MFAYSGGICTSFSILGQEKKAPLRVGTGLKTSWHEICQFFFRSALCHTSIPEKFNDSASLFTLGRSTSSFSRRKKSFPATVVDPASIREWEVLFQSPEGRERERERRRRTAVKR